MDVYFLICIYEQNPRNYSVMRILKCIPTTIDKVLDVHNEYMSAYLNYPGVTCSLVYRNADLSFLQKEAEKSTGE